MYFRTFDVFMEHDVHFKIIIIVCIGIGDLFGLGAYHIGNSSYIDDFTYNMMVVIWLFVPSGSKLFYHRPSIRYIVDSSSRLVNAPNDRSRIIKLVSMSLKPNLLRDFVVEMEVLQSQIPVNRRRVATSKRNLPLIPVTEAFEFRRIDVVFVPKAWSTFSLPRILSLVDVSMNSIDLHADVLRYSFESIADFDAISTPVAV